jgi:hypothetical protein
MPTVGTWATLAFKFQANEDKYVDVDALARPLQGRKSQAPLVISFPLPSCPGGVRLAHQPKKLKLSAR